MDSHTILYIIILIITASFVFETVLELLNLNYSKNPVPEILKDIYDSERYEKAMRYERETTVFGLIKSAVSFVVTIAMFLWGGFALLHDWAINLSDNPITVTLVFFGFITVLMYLFNIPFSYYRTFVIEEKYGFNKSTVKTFIADQIKSFVLTLIIGGLLLFVITWLYCKINDLFWLLAWGVITAFTLFMVMFYSDIIVPLFNKQVPLEEGELKDKILDFARKAGFEVDKIYKIDGSKRSTKANAYFSGLGKRKRIVLYDTLIDTMSPDEIVAVLAHEIGHYKHKHILKSFVFNTIHTGILLYVFSLVSQSKDLSEALLHSPLGYNSSSQIQAYFHLNIIVFSLLYSPVSTVLEIMMNAFSRHNEYEADNYAKKHGLAMYLVSALKKLAANNMSNLTPHPLYVKVYYSHPPLKDRIGNLLNE